MFVKKNLCKINNILCFYKAQKAKKNNKPTKDSGNFHSKKRGRSQK